ncbi:MAG: 30S ribosomal protein S20 [Candidatus Komeilibacteria bacterium RIFCSPLOWO2_01_FULL_45_10]|uniref:Small ribosomal subunit protein bS20 n=1 Tax=Candidatus Komeilibacteria bacterium RIFCSPLOWO2_01_FULL_45_10 TaxID=1798550 RepID=A0A1G2BJ58_9BACT|nr:MAG: 30S ribosomal protein S20 [Candidatus Komeilibacteria bacterium RIFCSPLOWO2_01_FULL_45_10]HLC63860.1 30S ribosomal protein S20 [Patescibacteria group bacterium]
MPIKQSAKKELRKAKKRVLKNLKEKRLIRDLKKKILKILPQGEAAPLKELLIKFQKEVDKAVKRGWLKKNNAGRQKSRLAALVKKARKT